LSEVTSGDCLENLFSSISGGGGGSSSSCLSEVNSGDCLENLFSSISCSGGATAFRSLVTPGDPILLCYQEVLLLATPYLF
jgi:hypothetical protein